MEKQSEIVGLRFTKSELAEIKEKAGLIPVATYLKNIFLTKLIYLDKMEKPCNHKFFKYNQFNLKDCLSQLFI